jgi:hypothetical protein
VKDGNGQFRLLGRPPETFIGYPIEARATESELFSKGYLYNSPAYPRAREIYEQIKDSPNRHPYHVSIEGISTEPEKKTNIIRKTVVLNALIHPTTMNPYTWISPGHNLEVWNNIAKALMAGEVSSPDDYSTKEFQPQDRGDKYSRMKNKRNRKRKGKRTQCARGCETLNNQLQKAVGIHDIGKIWLRHLVADHHHSVEEAIQTIVTKTIPLIKR